MNEEDEMLRGEKQLSQPRMRHETHQMTKLFQAHKNDNAILEPSALCVRCALVNKLYCTDAYCEWVSCLQKEVPT